MLEGEAAFGFGIVLQAVVAAVIAHPGLADALGQRDRSLEEPSAAYRGVVDRRAVVHRVFALHQVSAISSAIRRDASVASDCSISISAMRWARTSASPAICSASGSASSTLAASVSRSRPRADP